MAWEYSKLDKKVTSRWKKLGDLGEDLAVILLEKAGFKNIKNLNRERQNRIFADIYAKRDQVSYVISVKARNKYENNGNLNGRYKLGANCYEKSAEIEKEFKAQAAWVTIAIGIDTGTFDAYFGTLKSLNDNKGVPMTERATSNYEKLAWKEKFEDYGITKDTYKNLKNTYRSKK